MTMAISHDADRWDRGFAWLWLILSVGILPVAVFFIGKDTIDGGWNRIFQYPLEGFPIVIIIGLICDAPFIYNAYHTRHLR